MADNSADNVANQPDSVAEPSAAETTPVAVEPAEVPPAGETPVAGISYMPSTGALIWVGAFILLAIVGYRHVSSPRYRFEAGWNALELGDLDGAQREANRLARSPGSLPFGKLLEGELIIRRQGDALDAKSLQAAEQSFQAAAADDSLSALALALAGRARLIAGDSQTASQLLQSSLKVDSTRPEAYRYTGLLMYYNNQFEQAVKLLTKCVQLTPADPRPLELMGRCYRSLGKLPEATESFRRALALNPTQETREFLATCLLDSGDIVAAEAELAQCVERSPSVDFLTARCALSKQQLDVARTAIDAALARSPQDLDALNLKGQIALAAGDGDAAVAAYTLVVKAAPTAPEAQKKLGESYAMQGDTAQAEEHNAKAAELQTKWDRLQELTNSIREKPTDPQPIMEIGQLYRELDRLEEAAYAYQMVLSIDPQHAAARAALEEIGSANSSDSTSPDKPKEKAE